MPSKQQQQQHIKRGVEVILDDGIKHVDDKMVWTSYGIRLPLKSNFDLMKTLTVYATQDVVIPGTETLRVYCFVRTSKFLYIPRYFAENNFGPCDLKFKQDIAPIDLKFNGNLFEYQKGIVEKTVTKFTSDTRNDQGGVWSIGTGMGKCLARDTPVLKHDGTVVSAQDVREGDILMGDDGGPRTVSGVNSGTEEMWTVTYQSGYSYTVNASHILTMLHVPTDTVTDISIDEYMQDAGSYCGIRRTVSFVGPFDNSDPDQVCDVVRRAVKNTDPLPGYALRNNKVVRERVLETLLEMNKKEEGGGVLSKGKYAREIISLLTGLGYTLKSYDPEGCFVADMRQSDQSKKSMRLMEVSIESTDEEDEYFGFTVDRNSRFMLGDCTVTHNTVMALKTISELKVRTLIVVHKSVLMNQWRERIEQFLPDCNVGVVQGNKLEIEGSDIVIGMIQTLTTRTYPRGTFDSFGMIVLDESHTICSKRFSQIMFKVQAKYRLGLSATPYRQDGLDVVLFNHIGPVFVDAHNTVVEPTIRVLATKKGETISERIKPSLNRAGMKNVPKMITDLTTCKLRNDFIIGFLNTVMTKTPGRNVLVFSDRVNHCKKLHEMLNESGATYSSSLFIGEMNSEALKRASDNADVLFATYGICTEGFDCPRLDTIIFATPRSKIEQAVGRIMRRVNVHKPIVYDIMDQYMRSQYTKRRRYYNERKYTVTFVDSNDKEVTKKKSESVAGSTGRYDCNLDYMIRRL